MRICLVLSSRRILVALTHLRNSSILIAWNLYQTFEISSITKHSSLLEIYTKFEIHSIYVIPCSLNNSCQPSSIQHRRLPNLSSGRLCPPIQCSFTNILSDIFIISSFDFLLFFFWFLYYGVSLIRCLTSLKFLGFLYLGSLHLIQPVKKFRSPFQIIKGPIFIIIIIIIIYIDYYYEFWPCNTAKEESLLYPPSKEIRW